MGTLFYWHWKNTFCMCHQNYWRKGKAPAQYLPISIKAGGHRRNAPSVSDHTEKGLTAPCTRPCCSVTEPCPTLYDPTGCSTPRFPVLHHLPEFPQTPVHWVSDAIQPSHPLSSPSPPAFSVQSLSRVRLCNPMNRSTPTLPVHYQLPEFTQTHVHRVGDAIQPSHPLLSPSPPAPNPSKHQGLFQWVNSSHQVAKGLEFQLQHQSFQWIPRTDLL